MDYIIQLFFETLPNVQYALSPLVLQGLLGAPGMVEQLNAAKRLERDAGIMSQRADARQRRGQDLLDRARRGDLEFNPFEFKFINRMGDQLDRTAEDQLAKEREQALASGMNMEGGSYGLEKMILGSEDAARKTSLQFKAGRDEALQNLGIMETRTDMANVRNKNRLLQDQIDQGREIFTEGFQMQEGAEDLSRSARDARRSAIGNFAKNTALNSLMMPGVDKFGDIFKQMENPLQEMQRLAKEKAEAEAKAAAEAKAQADIDQGVQDASYEEGGRFQMTEGEFNHDTNKKALIDEETGVKEAELTGGEGMFVFAENDMDFFNKAVRENDKEGLFKRVRKLMKQKRFK